VQEVHAPCRIPEHTQGRVQGQPRAQLVQNLPNAAQGTGAQQGQQSRAERSRAQQERMRKRYSVVLYQKADTVL